MLYRLFIFTINILLTSHYYCEITTIQLTRKLVNLGNFDETNRKIEVRNGKEINISKEYIEAPLNNYNNVQYYGNLFLGSNKEEFTVMLDISSNYLVIPSITCENCRKFTKKFNSSSSETYQNYTAVKVMRVKTNNF